jgi:CHAT domain-containing protein/tetratricopeptide (TPR) repeat protein
MVRIIWILGFFAASPWLRAQTFDVLYYQLEGKHRTQQYLECLKLKASMLRLLPELVDSSSANALFYIGDSFFQTGTPDSALVYFKKEVRIRELLKDKLYTDYSNSLYNLAAIYQQLGDYANARATAQMLLASDKQVFGETSDTYLDSFLFYADVLANEGLYSRAAEESQSLLKKLDPNQPGFYRLLAKHADQLAALGKYAASEAEFGRALALLRAEGDRAVEEATISVNLASLYVDKGLLIEAEELMTRALAVLQKDDSPAQQERYFATLNNYGFVLLALARYEEARAVYDRLLQHDAETYGGEHPVYAVTLNNVGLAYVDFGDYPRAEKLLVEALAAQEKIGGGDSYEFGSFSNNLGKALYLQNRATEALPHLQTALGVFAIDPGKESAEYATTLHNLGVANTILKNKKAIDYLKSAIQLRSSLLGAAHPRVGQSVLRLALYEWMVKNPKSAQAQFTATFTNYQAQISRYFPGLSEAEKSKFYYGALRPAFEIYSSFVREHVTKQPALAGDLYNLQLQTKGVIFYATQQVRQQITRSGNPELIRKYEQWLALKEQIASRYSRGDDGQLDSLETVSNTIEKELTRQSTAFSNTVTPAPASWQRVQEKLKPEEAAVEIIRYREYSPDSGGFFTGKVRYAALLLTKLAKHPQWIELPNEGNVIEKRNLNYYRNTIKFNIRDTLSYPIYWGTLQPFLKNVKRVYVAPDGAYHQLNLNTLFNATTKNYLFEEIEIENLTNTKDLVVAAAPGKNNNQYFLMGSPQFAVAKKEVTSAPAEKVNRGTRAGILRVFRGGEIAPLPGTEVEVSEIEKLIKANRGEVVPRTGTDAHEAAIKKMTPPRVLHVATHGFFLDDPDFGDAESVKKYIENPLLRCGLILAGAEDFINVGQNPAEPSEDGILTAQEVMNLNLEGTELVTLSACETGLGSIQNGEGVYGLKRAFAIAGADKVIMSLWNVDDEATQQLMTYFYQYWLGGATKEVAFRQAQNELRKKFPEPFYWGAFVMIGQ